MGPFIRWSVYTILIAGGLVVTVGFTVGPSLSSLAAQLISAGCGVVGLVGGYAIEAIHGRRRFNR